MGIKRTLRKIAKTFTGIRIVREIPHGFRIDYDIAQRCPNYSFNVILDVGANVGQSASGYVSKYPYSSIYCFEPIAESFNQLRHNLKGNGQVHCFQLALGACVGRGTMISEGVSTMNCLLDDGEPISHIDKKTESVNVSTLDAFCKTHNISHVSYLKIDTEGGDLDVLKGASDILDVKGVDFIEVEAGMSPRNKYHIPLEDLKHFLESHGYYIFGIYEQVSEWLEKKPNLRRTNPVFISERMIDQYRTN